MVCVDYYLKKKGTRLNDIQDDVRNTRTRLQLFDRYDGKFKSADPSHQHQC